MSVFAWDPSYSVSVEQFDAQHRRLFEIINSLSAAVERGAEAPLLIELVGQLAVYTRTHFLQEEVAMRRTGYPDLTAHQAQHASLIADVERYKNELLDGRRPDSAAISQFLQNWLVDHIRRSDKAYSSHMNAAGLR